MKRHGFCFLLCFCLLAGVSAGAADHPCELEIRREACPGFEEQALKPYRGRNPTHEKRDLPSAGACEKWARERLKIIRINTLRAKKVKVTYGGKDQGVYSEKGRCLQDEADKESRKKSE